MAQYKAEEAISGKSIMEPVYRKADRKFQYFSLGASLLGVFFGLRNGFVIWAVGPMLGWLLLILFAQRIPRRAFALGIVALLFILYIPWYMIYTYGQIETRFLFFVYGTLLIYYRNRITMFTTVITAALFLVGMYITIVNPAWELGDFFATYILEPAGLTMGRVHMTSLSLVIFGGVLIFMATSFEKDTRDTLALDVIQLRQIEVLDHNRQFAENMAKGELQSAEKVFEDDALGEALETMRQSLVEAKDREEQERFVNVGLNQAGELLRHQEQGLETLCDEVLQFLVDYLKGNQGAIFLLEEQEGDRYLDMYACYAYDRKKYLRQRIRPGQGLTGQTFLEGKTSYLKKIPTQYVQIKSGLGGSNPRNLILVPMRTPEGVKGVLELASFSEFAPYQIDLLEKLASDMASTFEVVRINDKTKRLLAETSSTAEELRTQEEEMRQNMEELEATQEEMRRKERTFQKEVEDLKAEHSIELINLKRELADARDKLRKAQKGEDSSPI